MIKNHINIAEILENCPKGTKLYSPLCGECTLERITDESKKILISTPTSCGATLTFHNDGKYYQMDNAECLLFPSKDQRDWSKFQQPFKDGDIVATTNGRWIGITTGGEKGKFITTYCVVQCDDNFAAYLDRKGEWAFNRLATEEEKKKLFDAIKENGYKWNPETKTLEKLPKFKVGDKIIKKNGLHVPFVITGVSDVYYWSNTENSVEVLRVSDQDDWELVPTKFDITTLKTFDKVLVRHNKDNKWCGSFFSHIDGNFHSHCYKYVTVAGKSYPMCIPYEGNERLRGTTDDCEDFYKTW